MGPGREDPVHGLFPARRSATAEQRRAPVGEGRTRAMSADPSGPHEAHRRLTLFFESRRLLRKGAKGPAKRRNDELEADFRRSAEEDAGLFGFDCPRVPVSVLLHVHAPIGGGPQLPPVAKAYLDALEGIAYADDRQIEHLEVRQDALEHPLMSGHLDPTSAAEEERTAAVFVEVEPVEDYTERYDRAYRSTLWRRGPTPWRGSWGIGDEKELRELRWRQKRGSHGPGAGLLRLLEEEKLRDGFLADIDRPGALPIVTEKIHQVLALPKLHRFLRQRSGAMLTLPLPGQEKGSSARWAGHRDAALDHFARTRPGLPFNGFVGLDIAVRGRSLHGKDLDNLAHSILGPFEEKLCVSRGTVVGYRVYAAVGEPEGIQVRVIDHPRLLQLTAILGEVDIDPPLLDRLERWAARHSAKS
jgi:hypothetical protein